MMQRFAPTLDIAGPDAQRGSTDPDEGSPVFTVTFVLYEKAGLERAEALTYWRTTHADLVRKVPGVERYVQQHAVGAPEEPPPFLGVASLYFADQEAFGTAAASAEFGAAVADVPNFASAELPTAFTEDLVIVG